MLSPLYVLLEHLEILLLCAAMPARTTAPLALAFPTIARPAVLLIFTTIILVYPLVPLGCSRTQLSAKIAYLRASPAQLLLFASAASSITTTITLLALTLLHVLLGLFLTQLLITVISALIIVQLVQCCLAIVPLAARLSFSIMTVASAPVLQACFKTVLFAKHAFLLV